MGNTSYDEFRKSIINVSDPAKEEAELSLDGGVEFRAIKQSTIERKERHRGLRTKRNFNVPSMKSMTTIVA